MLSVRCPTLFLAVVPGHPPPYKLPDRVAPQIWAENGIEFPPSKNPGSRFAPLAHADVRRAYAPADLLAKPEHALKCGELPVDGGVRGLLLLPMPNIGEGALRRDRLRAASSEEFS